MHNLELDVHCWLFVKQNPEIVLGNKSWRINVNGANLDEQIAEGKCSNCLPFSVRVHVCVCMCACVSDLKDGDVPAETLQRPGHLATFQPLLRRQTLQLFMEFHGCGCKSRRADERAAFKLQKKSKINREAGGVT